jgi:hypothetical protein
MTDFPGNVNKMSHSEVLGTHIEPEKQPKPGADTPMAEKPPEPVKENEEKPADTAEPVWPKKKRHWPGETK